MAENNEIGADFWVTSDLHLGHPLLTAKRGFDSTYQHDAAVLEALWSLPEQATLVCLGDISVRKDDYALAKLAELKTAKNLRMILTPGNHDRCHPLFGLQSQLHWLPRYQEVFDLVVENFQIAHNNQTVLFTHIPRTPDPYRSAALERWKAREGFDCVVHGHTHSAELLGPKHVNICLEATGMKPVHSDKLWEFIKQASKIRPKNVRRNTTLLKRD